MTTIYANITNGLAFPHDEVCNFLSTHGHNYKMGYFRLDAMPYSAVIRLLQGQPILVVDATAHNKPLTDGLRYGLTTWVLVFNRAIGYRDIIVAPWQTREMVKAAHSSAHRALVHRIRRLRAVYGDCCGPARIGPNELVRVECHRCFAYDDKPGLILAARSAK